MAAVSPAQNSSDVSLLSNSSEIVYVEEDPVEKNQRLVQVGILFSLSVLGLLLNVPIIALLCMKRRRRKNGFRNIDFLILHLSVADVLVAGFCLLTDAIWKLTYQWLAGNIACKVVKYMQMFSLYASTFIIVAISLDRCLIILNPLPRLSQHSIGKILTLMAWILASIFSIPQMLIFRVEKAPFTVDEQELFQCCTHGAYSQAWQETAYVLFTFCVIFAGPLLVIFASYIIIFVQLSKKNIIVQGKDDLRRTYSVTSNNRENTMKRAKKKAFWISILVIMAFVICWAPYHFAMIYFVIAHQEMDQASVINAFQHIFFFGMSNSIINPVIYGAFHFVRKSEKEPKKGLARLQHHETFQNKSQHHHALTKSFQLQTGNFQTDASH